MLTFAHATALSSEDARPFEHSVALAHRAGATLCSVHAGGELPSAIPEAHELLARWKAEGPLTHERVVHSCCDDPVDTVLDALRQIAPDLVVCATHQRSGVLRIFADSRAESLADNLSVPTLLFPIGAPGFVSHEDGAITLKRIVIPIGDRQSAEAAIAKATWLGDLIGVERLELELLHVGAGDAPRVDVPLRAGWTWRFVQAEGALDEVVDERGGDEGGCLVIMATRGRDSLGDALLGSHTERVLRRAHCPLLMVPIA